MYARASPATRPGPLVGTRVVELAGLGPAPFAAMCLADLGADVVRIDRPAPVAVADAFTRSLVLHRSRRSIALDLKASSDRETALHLVDRADALIEGYRPGVMERLGLGPDTCLGRNPRLVYARLTGWGQDGPLAHTAGHDINYLAHSGVLDAIRRPGERPIPPLNLVADFGGGGLLAVCGILAGLLAAGRNGRGQVVDVAMVDGVALLSAGMWMLRALGSHNDPPGSNVFDGGSPFYDIFETSDRRFVAVGAIEPEFDALLCERLEANPSLTGRGHRDDRSTWPARKEAMARLFRQRTRDEWVAAFAGTDACVSPVLSFDEAVDDEHNRYRGSLVEVDGVVQPSPAPRFSETPGSIGRPPPHPGEHASEILAEWLGSSPAGPAT
jgi:alpha-methylacyl-CoA racemase